jgi:hypothetical protein
VRLWSRERSEWEHGSHSPRSERSERRNVFQWCGRVGIKGVVVPEEFFVGWAEVLEAVFESPWELIAFRDVLGECFPAVTGWEFIVVLEDFPRWHPSTCVVHVGQHT